MAKLLCTPSSLSYVVPRDFAFRAAFNTLFELYGVEPYVNVHGCDNVIHLQGGPGSTQRLTYRYHSELLTVADGTVSVVHQLTGSRLVINTRQYYDLPSPLLDVPRTFNGVEIQYHIVVAKYPTHYTAIGGEDRGLCLYYTAAPQDPRVRKVKELIDSIAEQKACLEADKALLNKQIDLLLKTDE